MAKENDYRKQLMELGVYAPAFDSVIHDLCILERELSRAMKAWKLTAENGAAPLATDPMYQVITKQRRDILAYRDALGLTPKALQRLRRQNIQSSEAAPTPSTGNAAFASLLDGLMEKSNAGSP